MLWLLLCTTNALLEALEGVHALRLVASNAQSELVGAARAFCTVEANASLLRPAVQVLGEVVERLSVAKIVPPDLARASMLQQKAPATKFKTVENGPIDRNAIAGLHDLGVFQVRAAKQAPAKLALDQTFVRV